MRKLFLYTFILMQLISIFEISKANAEESKIQFSEPVENLFPISTTLKLLKKPIDQTLSNFLELNQSLSLPENNSILIDSENNISGRVLFTSDLSNNDQYRLTTLKIMQANGYPLLNYSITDLATSKLAKIQLSDLLDSQVEWLADKNIFQQQVVVTVGETKMFSTQITRNNTMTSASIVLLESIFMDHIDISNTDILSQINSRTLNIDIRMKSDNQSTISSIINLNLLKNINKNEILGSESFKNFNGPINVSEISNLFQNNWVQYINNTWPMIVKQVFDMFNKQGQTIQVSS